MSFPKQATAKRQDQLDREARFNQISQLVRTITEFTSPWLRERPAFFGLEGDMDRWGNELNELSTPKYKGKRFCKKYREDILRALLSYIMSGSDEQDVCKARRILSSHFALHQTCHYDLLFKRHDAPIFQFGYVILYNGGVWEVVLEEIRKLLHILAEDDYDLMIVEDEAEVNDDKVGLGEEVMLRRLVCVLELTFPLLQHEFQTGAMSKLRSSLPLLLKMYFITEDNQLWQLLSKLFEIANGVSRPAADFAQFADEFISLLVNHEWSKKEEEARLAMLEPPLLRQRVTSALLAHRGNSSPTQECQPGPSGSQMQLEPHA